MVAKAPISWNGGSGEDLVWYLFDPAGIEADLQAGTVRDGTGDIDTLIAVEDIVGSQFDDQILGDTGENFMAGDVGNDFISGRSEDDFIRAGDGRDTINGGAGFDTLSYTRTDGDIDTFSNIAHINSSEFDDTLLGDNQDNIMSAFDGDDLLRGGRGDDMLVGGVGNDTLMGGHGSDFASYFSSNGNAIVDLRAGIAQDGNGDQDILRSIENIAGSDLGNDELWGGAGEDELRFDHNARALEHGTSELIVDLNAGMGFATADRLSTETQIASIENIVGTYSVDGDLRELQINLLATGTHSNNRLIGGAGDDHLEASPDLIA